MPHKRNPITAERLTGLARLLRGFALAGMEDQALWHERDISHSSVERVALPGATTLLHYMLVRFGGMVEGMVVRADRMAENIERGLGLHASSRLLTALVETGGLSREDAYAIVQRAALRAADERRSFRGLVEADPGVMAVLTTDQLAAVFDDALPLRHASTILERLDAIAPAREPIGAR
jgi:adenylosuccinate lyase